MEVKTGGYSIVKLQSPRCSSITTFNKMCILERCFRRGKPPPAGPGLRERHDEPGGGLRGLELGGGCSGLASAIHKQMQVLPASLGKPPGPGCCPPSDARFTPEPQEKRRVPSPAGCLPRAQPGPPLTGVVLLLGKHPPRPLHGEAPPHSLTPEARRPCGQGARMEKWNPKHMSEGGW